MAGAKTRSGVPPIPLDEIERLLVRSAPMIKRHAAIIHVGGEFIYSGVYAASFGYEGILTAGHCATDFLAAADIALSVSDVRHRLWVKSGAFEHVRIGFDETEGYTASGPDLSFVIIRDENLLRAIKSQSLEFYDLDHHRRRVNEVFTHEMHNINWAVEGNPAERIEVKTETADGREETTTITTAALVQGNLAGYELREPFDYVTLLVGRGFEEFPDSYTGVSGGGIWYQRFVSNDRKTYEVDPILAGIAVWQSRNPTIKDGWKVGTVTGHAWVSIYGQVRLALHDKRVDERHTQ